MWKNKKKLLFLLAFSSLLMAQNNSDTMTGNDHSESATTKSISSDLMSQKNYDFIEKALRIRNKELKDLYKQSDYIVKPEYLEWQVFFTGFYEKSHRGGNSDEKPFRSVSPGTPPVEVPAPKREIISSIGKSLKSAFVVYKNSVNVTANTPI